MFEIHSKGEVRLTKMAALQNRWCQFRNQNQDNQLERSDSFTLHLSPSVYNTKVGASNADGSAFASPTTSHPTTTSSECAANVSGCSAVRQELDADDALSAYTGQQTLRYIFSSALRERPTSLRMLQKPLRDVYLAHMSGDHTSVPCVVEIMADGLRVQYAERDGSDIVEMLNPFPTIAYWAAVQCVVRPHAARATTSVSADADKPSPNEGVRIGFFPFAQNGDWLVEKGTCVERLLSTIDTDDAQTGFCDGQSQSPNNANGACRVQSDEPEAEQNRNRNLLTAEHPPLFACIMRSSSVASTQDLQCHVFLCTHSKQAIFLASELYKRLNCNLRHQIPASRKSSAASRGHQNLSRNNAGSMCRPPSDRRPLRTPIASSRQITESTLLQCRQHPCLNGGLCGTDFYEGGEIFKSLSGNHQQKFDQESIGDTALCCLCSQRQQQRRPTRKLATRRSSSFSHLIDGLRHLGMKDPTPGVLGNGLRATGFRQKFRARFQLGGKSVRPQQCSATDAIDAQSKSKHSVTPSSKSTPKTFQASKSAKSDFKRSSQRYRSFIRCPLRRRTTLPSAISKINNWRVRHFGQQSTPNTVNSKTRNSHRNSIINADDESSNLEDFACARGIYQSIGDNIKRTAERQTMPIHRPGWMKLLGLVDGKQQSQTKYQRHGDRIRWQGKEGAAPFLHQVAPRDVKCKLGRRMHVTTKPETNKIMHPKLEHITLIESGPPEKTPINRPVAPPRKLNREQLRPTQPDLPYANLNDSQSGIQMTNPETQLKQDETGYRVPPGLVAVEIAPHNYNGQNDTIISLEEKITQTDETVIPPAAPNLVPSTEQAYEELVEDDCQDSPANLAEALNPDPPPASIKRKYLLTPLLAPRKNHDSVGDISASPILCALERYAKFRDNDADAISNSSSSDDGEKFGSLEGDLMFMPANPTFAVPPTALNKVRSRLAQPQLVLRRFLGMPLVKGARKPPRNTCYDSKSSLLSKNGEGFDFQQPAPFSNKPKDRFTKDGAALRKKDAEIVSVLEQIMQCAAAAAAAAADTEESPGESDERSSPDSSADHHVTGPAASGGLLYVDEVDRLNRRSIMADQSNSNWGWATFLP